MWFKCLNNKRPIHGAKKPYSAVGRMPTRAAEYSRVDSIDPSAKGSRIRPFPRVIPNIWDTGDKDRSLNCLRASRLLGLLFETGHVSPELRWRSNHPSVASNGISIARGSAGFRTNL
jgi:hypothetical protein